MPSWLSNAVFYEIYPQSFQDSNADGIGDFGGILQRLYYIRELGCNAIWMNPCFESPFMDAGYDVADYFKAAPRYGTNEDLKRIFDEVHRLGMHILLDLVPGHTSDQHPWFLESKRAEPNNYSDRYIWTKNIWENPDYLQSIRGISDRDGSCAVNFFSSQPALNYGYAKPDKDYQMAPADPEPMRTRAVMKDIMKFWLTLGCDGFRVDMAHSLIKGDDENGTENIRLWQDFSGFINKEFPEAALVAEWGEPKKSLAGGFHMDFLLHFNSEGYNSLFRCEEPYFSKRGRGTIDAFLREYMDMYSASAGKGLICIPSGNHDMIRLAKGRDMEELKVCFAFLLSMPGVPYIYYGDEIGMRYLEGLRSVEGGFNRTGSRSPMQWDDGVNAGFSTAGPDKLYIRIDEEKDRPTVKKQLSEEASLLNTVKKLIAIRLEYPELQSLGRIEFLHSGEQQYPLVYVRRSGNRELLVAINPSDREEHIRIDRKVSKVIYSQGGAASVKDGTLRIPPCSATFWV
jgi:maltose alpha-D-glucosyltransferase/alpha-amylase